MDVYVAGKTQDLPRVRLVQGLVKSTGHTITYDWTKIIDQEGGDSNEVSISKERRTKYALEDMRGIYRADLLIAVGHPNLCGTLWECGMAAAGGIYTWLLFWEECSRHSIFEDLPNVQILTFQEAGEHLWRITSGKGP